MRYIFFILLALVGCSVAHEDDNTPPFHSPESVTVATDASVEATPDATIPDSATPMVTHFQVYLVPGSTAGAENALLRAMRAWEQTTVGAVSFTYHLQGETEVAGKTCENDTIVFGSAAPSNTDSSFEDKIGFHYRYPKGCHAIWVSDPWAPELKDVYTSTYSRLKVDPLVMVAMHELGHAIGVPHAAITDRSVMYPTINMLKVNHVTCLDVTLLSVSLGRPVACHEDNDTPDGG